MKAVIAVPALLIFSALLVLLLHCSNGVLR
jgi:hypothetical protein